jgi:murein DD-endopeptidase MepM/ murein hydrolase activator NlpD
MDLLTQPLDLGFGVLDIPDRDQGPIAAPEGVPSGAGGPMGTAYGVDLGRLATATGAAEGDYDSVGVTVRGGGHGLGRYQFMTYRSDTMAVIRKNAKATGEEAIAEDLLKRANGSDRNAARKLLKYFPPKDQDALFAEHATNTLTQIKRKYPNATQEFLVRRFGAAHISGSFEDLTTPDALGTTGAMHGEKIWREYKKAKPSAPTSSTPSPATPLPRSRVIDEIDVSGPKGGLPDVGLSGGGGEYGAPRKGRRHAGIDIGTSGQKGWLVGFKSSGTVTYAGAAGGYGLLVIIRSGNTEYYFAHLARIFVKKGPYNGEAIGEIGNTGIGSGIHLHYEVRPNGQPINPRPYLNLLDIGRKTVPLSTPISAANVPATTSSPVSAQIASAKPTEASQNASQLAKERRGQTIIVPIPDQTQIAQTTPTIGGSSRRGNPMQSAGFDKNALNSMSHMQLTSLA